MKRNRGPNPLRKFQARALRCQNIGDGRIIPHITTFCSFVDDRLYFVDAMSCARIDSFSASCSGVIEDFSGNPAAPKGRPFHPARWFVRSSAFSWASRFLLSRWQFSCFNDTNIKHEKIKFIRPQPKFSAQSAQFDVGRSPAGRPVEARLSVERFSPLLSQTLPFARRPVGFSCSSDRDTFL
jgi:hypothetical protein